MYLKNKNSSYPVNYVYLNKNFLLMEVTIMNQNHNEPKTIKNRIKRLLGYHWAPKQHLHLILKDGRFYELVDQPYYRMIHYDKEWGGVVNIGFRTINTELTEVRTADGIPFTISAYMRVRFDPRKCELPDVRGRLASMKPEHISSIPNRVLNESLHAVVRSQESHNIYYGHNINTLQRSALALIKNELSRLGYTVFGTVQITKITPPVQLEKRNLDRLLIPMLQNLMNNANGYQLALYERLMNAKDGNGALNVLLTEGHQPSSSIVSPDGVPQHVVSNLNKKPTPYVSNGKVSGD